MSEQQPNPLDDMNITIELTVRGVNVLLAMLDRPQQIPSTMAAEMINVIHNQASPQIEQAKAGLEAALKASEQANESQTAS
jgi:hypothetical protein